LNHTWLNTLAKEETKEAYNYIIHRRRNLPFVNLVKEFPVLDVGCGSGNNCIVLKGLVICLDISYRQLMEAKKRGCENLIQADMEYLPIRSDSIMNVICFATLHHLPEPSNALKEIKRVLKGKGKVLITVWLIQPRFLFRRFIWMKSRIDNNFTVKRFFRLYYPLELKKVMERQGFETLSYKIYRIKSLLPNNAFYYGEKRLN